MEARRVLFSLTVVGVPALSAACSLVYEDYDARFAAGDASAGSALSVFAAEDADISTVATTTSAVYYSVGARVVRVSRDGGVRSVVWTGAAGGGFPPPSVLALVSDGVRNLGWSYGEETDAVYIADPSSDAAPTRVAHGARAYGSHMASDSTSVVWSEETADAAPGRDVPLFYVYEWKSGGTAELALSTTAKNYRADAVGLTSTSIYAHVVNVGFLVWSRATPGPPQVCPGFGPTNGAGLTARTAVLYVVLAGEGVGGTGSLIRYETDGGCPAVDGGVVLDPSGNVEDYLVSDGANVYWVTGSGLLRRAALGGGDIETLNTVPLTGKPSALAIDDASVYLAAGNTIYQFRKSSESD